MPIPAAPTSGAPGRPPTYRALTLGAGLRAAAGRRPDKVALQEGDRALTFSDLITRIGRVGNAASGGMGLQPGAHAAILAPNCLEFAEIIAGLSEAGVATATVSARSSVAEIGEICGDAAARLLIVHPSLEEAARAADLPSVEKIVVLGDDYERWLGDASSAPRDAVAEEWDPMCIQYTSGTTGRPKGVLISHRSRTLNYLAMSVEYGCYGPEDRALAIAPMYHGAGLSFALAPIFFGGSCEICPKFDAEDVLRRLSGGSHTNVFMVPTHFSAIFALGASVLARLRPTTLRTIISNAAPLSQSAKEAIVEYFGAGLLFECYGTTEGGVTTNLRPEDQLRKRNCVGLPFPCTEVRVVDDAGVTVAPGEVGEVLNRSPFLFNGYWNRPQESAETMRDGWYATGDLATRDDEGYLYIVDRKHDLIISGGINVFPREVELALEQHPAVREVAVYGAADPHWGEVVAAAVVCEPGRSVTERELLGTCEALGRYKTPKRVEFVDALPRNASGKVLRRTLRGQADAAAASRLPTETVDS